MPPMIVQPATDADMPRLAAIMSAAFEHNEPFVDAMWPRHWTAAGQRAMATRFSDAARNDPSARLLKAVDTETGATVGYAKWLVHEHRIASAYPLDGPWWDHDPDARRLVDALTPRFLAWRHGMLERTGGNLVALDVLAIDPPHQRRGAGTALVKWGVEQADELDLDAVVEASELGRGLYEKFGFEWRENWSAGVSDIEGFEDKPPQECACLVRPKKENSLL